MVPTPLLDVDVRWSPGSGNPYVPGYSRWCMGFEIDVEWNFDEKEFRNMVVDHVEDAVREWLESEAGDGRIECDCGSRSFDVETWTNTQGRIEAAGICRECNERLDIKVDASELEALR